MQIEREPSPQPERGEPRLADPGPGDLSRRDYVAVVRRAVAKARRDDLGDAAAALAYYGFTALPALLLTSLGAFVLLAGPDALDALASRLAGVAPPQAVTLLTDSLERALENQRGGVAMIAVGGLLALWTATGAMNALMRALNVAYERRETRGFLHRRLTALVLLAAAVAALGLVVVALVLGPYASGWVGAAVGLEETIGWIWWAAQWPVLLAVLLLAFAIVLYVGPDVDHPRWKFLTLGSAVAAVLWLAASGGFAAYVNFFGSYNKAWGSLAAVVVTLTWLWASALTLLFGAEINAELERSRELRSGQPAERRILAPARG